VCLYLIGCDVKPTKKQENVTNNELVVEQTREEEQNVEIEYNTILIETGSSYSSVISDNEIYEFLNWMTIKNEDEYFEEPIGRKVYYKIVKWDMENFIPKEEITININKNLFFRLFRRKEYKAQLLNFLEDVRSFDYLYDSKSGTDTIFKQEDRDFIFLQFTSMKDSIWHSSFSNSELVTTKELNYVRYYSIPLFSLDRNYVIIYRSYHCGSLCAYGGYYVYRRIDKNNWVFVTSVNTWIS